MFPSGQYSWLQVTIKCWLALIFGLACSPAIAAELIVESGRGQAGPLRWDGLSVHYQTMDEADWQFRLEGLKRMDGLAIGDLIGSCPVSAEAATPGCEGGRLTWRREDELLLELGFSLLRSESSWRLEIAAPGWVMTATVPDDQPGDFEASLSFEDFDLSGLPSAVLAGAGLSVLEGRLDGSIRLPASEPLALDLRLQSVAFDTEDGLVAADGLSLSLNASLEHRLESLDFSGVLRQHSGELLAGSLYLPGPVDAITLNFAGQREGPERWHLKQLELIDPGALILRGQAVLQAGDEAWQLGSLELDHVEAEMPAFWQRWAESLMAQSGFAELETSGKVAGELRWNPADGWRADGMIESFDFSDPAGRLAVASLAGSFSWRPEGPETDLSWQGLSLYDLPFGASRLRLARDALGMVLIDPLVLPLLDGAVLIDRLDWQPGDAEQAGLRLDARILPLSLSKLTRQLGWPEFGGVLSGDFPGIIYSGEQLDFTGGILIRVFSGTIALDDLSIERPFGTLPALSAQVTIARLDLLELTGAFNFGRMEGRASGWMRDLRLLDWRPVRMDARFFTHDDVPRRRISQRAVDNLSSLGGAGGALISGTVLRAFEDFPYRRAGLACRLANNICHIDGVAPHESGGFYIVEGRALPRLDIIGHRRLVDWPQLIAQLETMMD